MGVKFTIGRTEALEVMSILGRIIPKESVTPELLHLRAVADQGRVRLEATDKVAWVSALLPEEDTDVNEAGAVLIRASKFADILKVATAASVAVEETGEDSEILVSAGFTEYGVKHGGEEGAWPNMEGRISFGKSLVVKQEDLKKAIDRCLVATSGAKEHSRFSGSSGVLFELTNRDITMVASDSKILVRQTFPATNDNFDPTKMKGKVIVPVQSLRVVREIKAEHVAICVSDKTDAIGFRASDLTIVSRLEEGSFPNWKQIMPRNTKVATINAEVFRRALRQSAVLAEDGVVRLEFDGSGQGKAFAQGPNTGRSSVGFPVVSPIKIAAAFKAEQLLTGIAMFETDADLKFGFVNADSPINMTEEDFDFICVPVINRR